MIKKTIFLIILFYLLTIIQISFLPHFNAKGYFPNFVIMVFLIIALLEEKGSYSGLVSALSAGLFLDIFSKKPIGFYIAILLTLFILIRFVVKKHLQVPKIL